MDLLGSFKYGLMLLLLLSTEVDSGKHNHESTYFVVYTLLNARDQVAQ